MYTFGLWSIQTSKGLRYYKIYIVHGELETSFILAITYIIIICYKYY